MNQNVKDLLGFLYIEIRGEIAMKKNVGDLDSFIRITMGLSILGIGIKKDSNIMIFLGAMNVAEGITRFCPLLSLIKFSTRGDKITS